MDDSFFKYLQQLEILGFFSGYPLVYALVSFIRGSSKSKANIRNTIFILLPFAYATTGLLYIGLQLRNLYPDYSIKHISAEIQTPFFAIWGLLSVLFWFPLLNKKPVFSLFHSLVFLYLLVKNFYLQLSSPVEDRSVLKNYMGVYSDSILLNIGVLIAVVFIYYTIKSLKKKAFTL
jgi:hypothetical protein